MISARMPIVTVLLLTAIVGATSSAKAAIPAPPFTLSSPDARWREHVPDIYIANAFGCAGGNTSPPLEWHNPPPGTKSFVLTLFDRDERSTPSGWWHWVVYDLPPGTRSLPAGAGAAHSALLPAGTKQGRTDLGNAAYHGPCPAKGDPPHRYVLTLYALSVETLPVDPESSGAMVTSTAQDSLLGKAVLLVHYGRP
jgi:Raf kinase inhibitor-like YbhB/YbcL family protein